MSKTRAQLRISCRRALRDVGRLYTTKTGTVTIVVPTLAHPEYDATAIVGTSTLFLTEYEVGKEIKVETEVREIIDIASNTALTVGRAFAQAHTAKPHARLDDRVWTDDEIDDALDEAVGELGNALWNNAPQALEGSVLMDLTANADTVTVPTTLRSYNLVEVLPLAGSAYVPLTEVAAYYKDSQWCYPWWTFYNATSKPLGIPSSYSVISPAQLELNVLPQATVANGLRFYGVLTASLASFETATLNLPDADVAGWDNIVANWACTKLCLSDEALPVGRADRFRNIGDGQLAPLLARWSLGRSTSPQQVRITHL